MGIHEFFCNICGGPFRSDGYRRPSGLPDDDDPNPFYLSCSCGIDLDGMQDDDEDEIEHYEECRYLGYDGRVISRAQLMACIRFKI